MVRSYQHVSGEPQVSAINLAVMFDSSHFTHGSTVTVEFVFPDSNGTWRQDDMQAPAKNRRISFGQSDPNQLPRGAPIPVGFVSGLNYSTKLRDADGWSGDDLLNDMDGATVVHFSGHGYGDHFGADSGADSGADVYAVENNSVLESRMAQMGSGLSPFNTTHSPPISPSFLNSCACGSSSIGTSFHYPYYDAYGNLCENMAFLGFIGKVFASQNARRGEIVYENLAQGFPAEAARMAL